MITTRKEALTRWKIKKGPMATYGNLLKLFMNAGYTQCAETICEMLKKKGELFKFTHMVHGTIGMSVK